MLSLHILLGLTCFFFVLSIAFQNLSLAILCLLFFWVPLPATLRAPLRQLALWMLIFAAIWPLADLVYGLKVLWQEDNLLQVQDLQIQGRIATFWPISAVFIWLRTLVPDGKINHTVQPQHIEALQKFLVWALVGLSVFGLVQFLTGWDPRADHAYREHGLVLGRFYRIEGLMGHPLSMASYALFFLGFFGFMASKSGSKRLSQNLLWFAATGAFLLVILSVGRTAIGVGLMAGLYLIVPSLKHKNPKAFIFGLGSLIFLLVLSSFFIWSRLDYLIAEWNAGKLPDRLQFWRVHLAVIQDSPWLGYGYTALNDGLRDMYYELLGLGDFPKKYNAHNLYLETLAEVGIIGTGAILVSLVKIAQQLSLMIVTPHARLFFQAFGFGLVLNLVHGLTQNTYYDSHLMLAVLFVGWILIFDLCITRKPS